MRPEFLEQGPGVGVQGSDDSFPCSCVGMHTLRSLKPDPGRGVKNEEIDNRL